MSPTAEIPEQQCACWGAEGGSITARWWQPPFLGKRGQNCEWRQRGKDRPCSTVFFAPLSGHMMGTLEGGWGCLSPLQDLPLARAMRAPGNVLPPALRDAQRGAFLQPFSAFLLLPQPPQEWQLSSPGPAPWGQRRLRPVFSTKARMVAGGGQKPGPGATAGLLPASPGRGERAPHPWASGPCGFE